MPACRTSFVGLTGGLMGTNRVSLPAEAAASDARKTASNRSAKISDGMVVLPWFGTILGNLVRGALPPVQSKM